MPLSPKEYAELNQFKPLTPKERKRGKEKLTISGTEKPMPWAEIYSRIQIGEPIDNIAEKFGHKRKIALWAIEDNIEYIPEVGEVLIEEVKHRKTMDMIAGENPVLAMTIKEAANEYAPDAARKSIKLSVSLLDAAQKILNSGDYTTNDLKNLADMHQKTTDTMELTKRHASGMNIESAKIQVSGFEFQLDEKPIDVEVDDDNDNPVS